MYTHTYIRIYCWPIFHVDGWALRVSIFASRHFIRVYTYTLFIRVYTYTLFMHTYVYI